MKRLFKALLWITCYGGACWFGIKTKLGFDILSQDHWKVLLDKSLHATWPAEMAPKKLVCRILLAFIIVGILGLSVITKKKKTRIPVVKGELPSKEDFRPSPMASQGKMAAPTPVAPSAPSNNNLVTPPPPPQPSNISLMGDAVRQITAVANTFDVSVFPHVKLENTFTQLVISDDSNALLLKILPQPGIWHVEQTLDILDSKWTQEGQTSQYTLKDIIQSTQTLTRLEPEANSIAVVILTNGGLEDPEGVKTYLNQNGIRLVTLFPEGKTLPNVPTWSDLLTEFYPKKEETTDETNEVS